MTNWQATPIRISSRDRAFYWRRIASRKGRQKSSAFGLTPAQRFQHWSIVPSGMDSSLKTLTQHFVLLSSGPCGTDFLQPPTAILIMTSQVDAHGQPPDLGQAHCCAAATI